MSRVAMILLLSWSVVFLKEIGLAVADDECSSNSDCDSSSSFGDVCCMGYSYDSRRKCRYGSCVGRYCSTHGDCGGAGECCSLFNKCTKTGCTECFSNFACASSEYCCQLRYSSDHNVCRRSCVGETCHSDSDCGGPGETCSSNHKCEIKSYTYCSTDGDCSGVGECCKSNKCTTIGCTECFSNFFCASSEYCCKQRYTNDQNVCRRSCVGETCHSDSDCGGPDETCGSDHECEKKTSGWVVAVITVGLVLFAIVVGGVFAYRCCRKTSQRGTVIAQRPARRTAAIIALQETEVTTVASPPPPAYSSPPPAYYNQGQDFSSPQPQQYYPPPQPQLYPPPPQQYPPAQPQQYPMP